MKTSNILLVIKSTFKMNMIIRNSYARSENKEFFLKLRSFLAVCYLGRLNLKSRRLFTLCYRTIIGLSKYINRRKMQHHPYWCLFVGNLKKLAHTKYVCKNIFMRRVVSNFQENIIKKINKKGPSMKMDNIKWFGMFW